MPRPLAATAPLADGEIRRLNGIHCLRVFAISSEDALQPTRGGAVDLKFDNKKKSDQLIIFYVDKHNLQKTD